MGFEPTTLALARRCSTTELFPLGCCGFDQVEETDFTEHLSLCQGNQMTSRQVHKIAHFQKKLVDIDAWSRPLGRYYSSSMRYLCVTSLSSCNIDNTT